MIRCENIVKTFGNHTALNGVSIDVPAGCIFGLLGPNGAGKTTLIRAINLITIPDSGSIFFGDRPICEEDVERIGYLPEERGLYKKMKVGEQALYLAQIKGMDYSTANRELKKWFTKFGIAPWWNKKIEELSKGMAQKVQFITTVVHNPKLLILDEPFSGFDPVNVQLIRDEILRMKANGTTVILSTHNMESVEELCDNIALINKSNLILSGNTRRIREDYGGNRVEVLYNGEEIGCEPSLYEIVESGEQDNCRRAVLELPADVTNSQVLGSLISKVDVCSYTKLVPRMKDIFIKLVSEN